MSMRRRAEPARDAGMRAELGERACMALMSRDDWRALLEVWVAQGMPETIGESQ